MAGRKRTGIVHSVEEIRAALIRSRGTEAEGIFQILLYIKEHPSESIKEVSDTFDMSERTIYRWLKMCRESGIEGIINRFIPPPSHENVAKDSGRSLTVSYIPKEKPLFYDTRLRTFLNALPQHADTVQWCKEMQTLLCDLLDVDRVVINIRTTLDLINPSGNRPGQVHRQSVFSDMAPQEGRKGISILHDTESGRKWEQIFEEGLGRGFAADKYHSPVGFDYYYQTTGSYLATVILFRNREHPPVSSRSIMFLEELRPFLIFLFSDHIARHRMAHPEDVLFRDLVTRINVDVDLTQREQEILMLLVLAYSYEEIAGYLFISVKTVESHVQTIYRKVGVNSLKGVFARYITPRLTFLE